MKLAVFQPEAGPATPRARLSALDQALKSHPVPAADLVLCPELFVSGYSDADPIRKAAGPVTGEFPAQLAALCRKHGVAIACGYPERDNNRLFNSALCLSATGKLLANHRKRVLPTAYEQDLFDTGVQATVFDFGNGWRVGMVICYEAEFPEAVRALALAGAQLVLVPTALGRDWRVVSRQVIPSRAFENNVYLAYANYAGEDSSCRYIGDSVIVSPMGTDLARAGMDPDWISAQLDAAAIDQARTRLPYLADHSRLA